MPIRTFAIVYGIVFLLVGIAGFVPGLVQPAMTNMDGMGHAGEGLLFGLFPINALHNVVHLAFGIAGLVAARHARWAWIYAVATAAIYFLLAAMGRASGPLDTTGGLIPLHGNNVWLHLVLAIGALAFAITGRGAWRETPPGDQKLRRR